jgi:hypothetical protein
MKSLNQIEPRIPISSLPFTITLAGSYYVTTNLTPAANQNGIIIAADNVTIDVNGFTLFGGGGVSGEAISASGPRANLVIRHGTVRNWPGSGVNLYDSGSSQAIIQDLRSISNGFTGIGIRNGSRAVDCTALGNGQRGILVDNDCVVERCKAAGNATAGIGAGLTSQLVNNQSVSNGTGLAVTGAGNIVADNIVKGNTANYNFASGNQLDLVLCELPASIDWSSRVKLVGSLNVTVSNAVTVTANDVTLDLNGFTISSTAASATGYGILLGSGLRNITIANGHIRGGVINNGSGVYNGSGFAYGIYYSGTGPANVQVSRISVSGCLYHGINLAAGNSTVAESCTVRTVGSYGIFASTIKQSAAMDCGSSAIYGDQVSDCRGESSGSGNGLNATIAQNCYGSSGGGGYGVSSTTALNCYGSSGSSGIGVYANIAQNCYASGGSYGVSSTTALNCYGSSGSSGIGVYANTAQNCHGENSGAGYGVYASSIASGCYGSSPSGTGLFAFIAHVCRGQTSSGTALSSTHNDNSF